MSATVTHSGRYSLLTVELPGQESASAGVLLEDPAADRLYVRLRRDWDRVAPDESEVLSALEDDLASKAAELGAAKLLANLEDTLSNTMRVTDRREAMVENFDRALNRLYREHVRSTEQPFVTHLPRYSLAVAAGAFLENRTVEAEGWEEAPLGLRLAPEMFVARVVGRSMEPLIPDGSLCVFRHGVTGSRQGRMVLVEELGGRADDRYTVKRYRSEKTHSAGEASEETWAHGRILLEPLNPQFEAWELKPEGERYRIVAEFVQVLD
jgi:phage repressor protein C with HTH and peptisase S24 domain